VLLLLLARFWVSIAWASLTGSLALAVFTLGQGFLLSGSCCGRGISFRLVFQGFLLPLLKPLVMQVTPPGIETEIANEDGGDDDNGPHPRALETKRTRSCPLDWIQLIHLSTKTISVFRPPIEKAPQNWANTDESKHQHPQCDDRHGCGS